LTPHSKGFILATQPNFRDLDGIPSTKRRTVKPGLIFRSGDLYNLSPEDIAVLETLGLRAIVDFRSDREISKRPDVQISTVTQHLHFPIEDAAREKAMQLFNERNAAGLKNLLVEDYRRMVSDHADAFRQFFRAISNRGHLPLVFHCAAGKDRTGLAAWFLLAALDVPEEIIREDYLATNIFSKSFADTIVKKTSENGFNGEIIRPLLEVRDEYIDAALDEIGNTFGRMDRFLVNELGVDKDKLKKIFLDTKIHEGDTKFHEKKW
jgi:protein-tyrosine phosphatase